MAWKIVKVHGKYRASEDPELGNINGKCLATLSKEEILVELEKRNLNGLEVCLLGSIEPEPEYLCKILHFCMEVDWADCEKRERQQRARRESRRLNQRDRRLRR